MSPLTRLFLTAAAFAACGAASSFLFHAPQDFVGWALFPLPFGLLAAFVCSERRMIPLVALWAIPVWNAAYWITDQTSRNTENMAPSFLLAGLVGGVGLAFGAGIGHRKTWKIGPLAGAAATGSIAALFFMPGMHDEGVFVLPFAIWQCAMGTYLYLMCR